MDVEVVSAELTDVVGDVLAGVATEAAAEASGDHAWPLPLHPRYRRYLDSTVADLVNTDMQKDGQPATAAAFLHEFVGETPWGRLDIAGTAYLSASRGDYLAQPGATGYGVRLIVELALSL